MSSHVVVTSSTARSTKVKVSPGTYMSDVLAQACKSLNVDADNFLLKHKQKNVNLSVPFRISGLHSGAKLDLVIKSKSPAPVTVAIAIPAPEGNAFTNGRLGGTFPSSFTIWQVLRQLESLPEASKARLNITARGVPATSNGKDSGSGQLYYESPALNIMGRELGSFQDFQKTLSQLGYNSGSVLIRLGYKKSEMTLVEAQQQITQYFMDLDTTGAAPSVPPKDGAGDADDTPENTAQAAVQPTPEPMDVQPTVAQPVEEAVVHPLPIQPPEAPRATLAESSASTAESAAAPPDFLEPVSIFAAPTSTTPAAARTAVNEADFTPTIAHAQLHQARLIQNSKNKRLPSDKELEEQAAAIEARVSSIQSIEVKVRFPDNTSASWVISQQDTGAKVYKAVRSIMADPSLPFKLVVPGSREVVSDSDAADNKLMRKYKLTGRVLINLLWDDSVPAAVRQRPFLKASAAQSAQEIVVPDLPAAEDDDDDKRKKSPPARQGIFPPDVNNQVDQTMKKINKFFKLPGRK